MPEDATPTPTPPALPEDAPIRRLAERLRLAADPTRLKLLFLLGTPDPDRTRSVGAICESLGLERAFLAHHLTLLRVSGLIEPIRQGKRALHALTPEGWALAESLRELLAELDG